MKYYRLLNHSLSSKVSFITDLLSLPPCSSLNFIRMHQVKALMALLGPIKVPLITVLRQHSACPAKIKPPFVSCTFQRALRMITQPASMNLLICLSVASLKIVSKPLKWWMQQMNNDLYHLFLNYTLLLSKLVTIDYSISRTFTVFLDLAVHLEFYLKVKS